MSTQPKRKRRWEAAREKVEAEGACRHCGSNRHLQAAHIIPRSRIGIGLGRGEDPRNVVPLCPTCHVDFDQGRLEVLPLLSLEEQGYISLLVGIEDAWRRTTKTTP